MHNCSYSNLKSFTKGTLEEAKEKMQIIKERCQISNAPFIQQIVDFINIDDPNQNQEGKTAKQIADALCLHPKTLNKLLKNSISKNPCVQLVAQREGRIFQYKYRFSSQSQSQKKNKNKSPQSLQFPTDLAYQAIIKPEIEKELLEDRAQIQKIEELVIKENLQKRFTYINLIRILFINKMIQSQGAVSQSEIRNQIKQELEQNKSTTEICRKSIKNLLQLMLQIKLIKLAVLKLYQLDGKYEIQIEDFSDIEKLNFEKKSKIKEQKKLQLKKWFGLKTNFDDYESLKKHSEFKFFTRQNQLQVQNATENLIIEEKNQKNNQEKKQIICESNDEIYLSEEEQKDQEIVKINQSQQEEQNNEQTAQYSIVTLDDLKHKLSQ